MRTVRCRLYREYEIFAYVRRHLGVFDVLDLLASGTRCAPALTHRSAMLTGAPMLSGRVRIDVIHSDRAMAVLVACIGGSASVLLGAAPPDTKAPVADALEASPRWSADQALVCGQRAIALLRKVSRARGVF